MTGDIEAAGDALTGGLVGRVIEPGHGEAAPGHQPVCLNCATALVGDYCHDCGQAGHIHRSLAAIWHDIAHSVLHFEGKIWRTLPLLIWRPGELTRRYIHGERARFVSPMALFLFSVFLMFAVFSVVGVPADFTGGPQEARLDVEKERASVEVKIAELEKEREAGRAEGRDTAELHEEISDARLELAALGLAKAAAGPGDPKTGLSAETGSKSLDDAIKKIEENPALLAYKMQANAYKFSWALIPISVPFVAMMFLHRRRYRQYRLYDHAVFVTYSLAFMTLAAVLLSVLQPLGIGETLTGLAIAFVPPIHMYRQLRGAYGLSRRSALWRAFVLVLSALLAVSLFTVLLAALGAFG